MTTNFSPSDWDAVRLVVFDVDGTLYRQRPLRLRMARDMLLYALRQRDLTPIRVLRVYRTIREELGEAETQDFNAVLLERTAAKTGVSKDKIEALVSEWMEKRPLVQLASCRYPALVELFQALKARGKQIGILSDYPVEAKLERLGLFADHIVWAGQDEVGVLKPHPRGLQHVMAEADVQPTETVLIGDRADRDGAAAQRSGTHALIRSDRPLAGWITFGRFDDALFAPLLGR
jgi:putative hydrolase of the HAD superfamily